MLLPMLLLGFAQSLSAPQAVVPDLPRLFAAACMDGQATLSAKDVTKVSFDALPAELKSSLGEPASGDVWRLNGNGEGYLYILNYADRPGVSPKICGVASDAMNLRLGAEMLDKRLAGSVLPNQVRTMRWLRPMDGYVATATTAARFDVLQINWLSTADRRRLAVEASSLPK